jgi:hypothetical protein
VLLVALTVSACAVGNGSSAAGPIASTPASPTPAGSQVRLSLSADVVDAGQRSYRFVAEIAGARTDDSSLYCQATTWGFGDGPALTVTPSCAPWAPGTTVQTRFENAHSYAVGGRYEATFAYGALTATATVEVK